jgi:C4-dicarboxylate transporter, DctM subunit
LSPFLIGLIAVIAFLALTMMGMPIGFSFTTVGFVGILFLKGLDPALSILGSMPYTWASNYNLVAVPLFILMGQFAFHSKISADLYDAAYKSVGKLPGGLALTTSLACTGFAACTGSSLASAATMGTIALPEMKKAHYDPGLATGCVAAGGTLGILIPPSVIFIIYGAMTWTSIGKLFIAGILPGLMLASMFLALIYFMCKRNLALGPPGPAFSFKERIASLAGIWGALVLFAIVIGGLYFGLFSPSEAGGVGAFGAFILLILKRRITKQNLSSALRDSARITCFSFTILIGAMIFGSLLSISALPAELTKWVVGLPISRYLILVLILVMYVPLGCIMDSLPMVLLTLPVVFPVIKTLGFDPVWFGVLLVLMSEMSLISPPVGINVFVVQGIAKDVPLEVVFRGVMPFIAVMAIAVAILVAFPQISLFLPNLMQ